MLSDTKSCSDRSKKKLKNSNKDLMSSSCITRKLLRSYSRSRKLNLNNKSKRPTDSRMTLNT